MTAFIDGTETLVVNGDKVPSSDVWTAEVWCVGSEAIVCRGRSDGGTRRRRSWGKQEGRKSDRLAMGPVPPVQVPRKEIIGGQVGPVSASQMRQIGSDSWRTKEESSGQGLDSKTGKGKELVALY